MRNNLIHVPFFLSSAWSFGSKEGIDEGNGGKSRNTGYISEQKSSCRKKRGVSVKAK